MTLQWIPLDSLVPHPENSNRMPPRLLAKLKRNIERTGLYEPLVVRPLNDNNCGLRNADCGLNGNNGSDTAAGAAAPDGARRLSAAAAPMYPPRGGHPPRRVNCDPPRNSLGAAVSNPQSAIHNPQSSPDPKSPADPRYQILNGHHRAQVLRELGHSHARCDVWEVSDDDARLLLATLNRLEGRDDPAARARLLARLAESPDGAGRSAEDLARLLPEPPDAIERLRRLTQPPDPPLAAESLAPLPRPMTFFLTEEQHALVTEALEEVKQNRGLKNDNNCGLRIADCGLKENNRGDTAMGEAAPDGARRLGVHPPGRVNCDPPRNSSSDPPRNLPGEAVSNPQSAIHNPQSPPQLSRCDALERLALWYLESRNLR